MYISESSIAHIILGKVTFEFIFRDNEKYT